MTKFLEDIKVEMTHPIQRSYIQKNKPSYFSLRTSHSEEEFGTAIRTRFFLTFEREGWVNSDDRDREYEFLKKSFLQSVARHVYGDIVELVFEELDDAIFNHDIEKVKKFRTNLMKLLDVK